MQGPLGVVFESSRRAERGHHRVSGELLDRPAAPFDLLGHGLVETVEDEPCALGILLVSHRGRSHEVREQHGRELPLFVDSFREQRRGAVQAEPGALRVLLTA